MTMKNYAKFEEQLTCHFKVDMRNLTNFDLSTLNSQIFSFDLWFEKRLGKFSPEHLKVSKLGL